MQIPSADRDDDRFVIFRQGEQDLLWQIRTPKFLAGFDASARIFSPMASSPSRAAPRTTSVNVPVASRRVYRPTGREIDFIPVCIHQFRINTLQYQLLRHLGKEHADEPRAYDDVVTIVTLQKLGVFDGKNFCDDLRWTASPDAGPPRNPGAAGS